MAAQNKKEVSLLKPSGNEFYNRLIDKDTNQLNLEFLRTLDLICKKENIQFRLTVPFSVKIKHLQDMFVNIVLDFC
jgi:hypothetical protein